MNPKETEELTEFIRHIRDEYNLTIFMIEHHMNLVMEISDWIYVLDLVLLLPKVLLRKSNIINVLSTHIWGWMKMLKIENLVVSYGGIEALKGISLDVPDGKIVTLIGANGAGKAPCCVVLWD